MIFISYCGQCYKTQNTRIWGEQEHGVDEICERTRLVWEMRRGVILMDLFLMDL